VCTAISFIFYETISIQTFRIAFEHFVSYKYIFNNYQEIFRRKKMCIWLHNVHTIEYIAIHKYVFKNYKTVNKVNFHRYLYLPHNWTLIKKNVSLLKKTIGFRNSSIEVIIILMKFYLMINFKALDVVTSWSVAQAASVAPFWYLKYHLCLWRHFFLFLEKKKNLWSIFEV
jgi:hypothetical protein